MHFGVGQPAGGGVPSVPLKDRHLNLLHLLVAET
jgi:hypothetical protein